MRLRHLVALLLGAVLTVFIGTSCLSPAQGPDEPVEAAGEEMARANPWSFTVTIPWDGQDGAGGEQEATAPVEFVTATMPPHFFSCTVRVRMPVRTVKYKEITRRYAADVTLAVSNEAANLMDWRYWGEPTSVYCRQFVEKMQHVFLERYAGIGARVTGP